MAAFTPVWVAARTRIKPEGKINTMKQIFTLILIMLISTAALAQSSNAFSSQKFYEEDGYFVVDLAFTTDSLAALVSNSFSVPVPNGFTWDEKKVVAKYKMVSNTGNGATNYKYVLLQGVFQSETDTIAIDTIAFKGQTEADTLALINLNGREAIGKYKVWILSNVNDVDTGTLSLRFPIGRRELESSIPSAKRKK